MVEKAIDKINEEYKQCKKLSKHGAVVGKSVVEALELFCRQSKEFAQAVVNCSQSVGECIESTVKGCGSSISDIEVYQRAAAFYFDGAQVRFEMIVDLGDGGYSGDEEQVGAAAGGLGAGDGPDGAGNIDVDSAGDNGGSEDAPVGLGSGSAAVECGDNGSAGKIDVSGAGSRDDLQSIAPAHIRLSLDDLL